MLLLFKSEHNPNSNKLTIFLAMPGDDGKLSVKDRGAATTTTTTTTTNHNDNNDNNNRNNSNTTTNNHNHNAYITTRT